MNTGEEQSLHHQRVIPKTKDSSAHHVRGLVEDGGEAQKSIARELVRTAEPSLTKVKTV